MSRAPRPTAPPRERLLLCGVRSPHIDGGTDADLSEAAGLVAAADGEVAGEGILQRRAHPVPATLMGRGKVDELRAEVERLKPSGVVVDNDLTPAQIRNLEKAWGCRVIDRSELILDIFARRAQTRQARLQVELAQNEYLFPRLRRMWTHLERTEGAIGTRGPGETQLETDRRLLRKRIQDLKGALAEIEARRERQVRSRAERFTVGLVGYTNAGKSTLLNRLTGSHELEADMLFATLDTRTRKWRLPDGRVVLLSDTVGFLQRLPHHLVASFHATLEETLHADLLLHVVDAAHPDAAAQMRAVDEVLRSLSYDSRAGLVVFNKIDRVEDPLQVHLLASELEGAPGEGPPVETVHVSARTGVGLDRLAAAVTRRLDLRSGLVEVRTPLADGRVASHARRLGAVQEEEHLAEEGRSRLVLRITEGALGNLRRLAGGDAEFDVLEPAREGWTGAAEDPPDPFWERA